MFIVHFISRAKKMNSLSMSWFVKPNRPNRVIIIIINNQPTVKESCPDGNGTLNSRVELQPLKCLVVFLFKSKVLMH